MGIWNRCFWSIFVVILCDWCTSPAMILFDDMTINHCECFQLIRTMGVCTITESKRVSFNTGETYTGSALFWSHRQQAWPQNLYSFELSAETFKGLTQGGHSCRRPDAMATWLNTWYSVGNSLDWRLFLSGRLEAREECKPVYDLSLPHSRYGMIALSPIKRKARPHQNNFSDGSCRDLHASLQGQRH